MSALKGKPECHYHDAYANLAAAIIHSGELQNDKAFLNSDWCNILKEICELDDEMYGGRNIEMRGQIKLSASKGGKINEFN